METQLEKNIRQLDSVSFKINKTIDIINTELIKNTKIIVDMQQLIIDNYPIIDK